MAKSNSVTSKALVAPMKQLKRAIASFEEKKSELIMRDGAFIFVLGESPKLKAAIVIHNRLEKAMREYEHDKNIDQLLNKCKIIFNVSADEVEILSKCSDFQKAINSIINAINWVANRLCKRDTPFIEPLKTDSAHRLENIQHALDGVHEAAFERAPSNP